MHISILFSFMCINTHLYSFWSSPDRAAEKPTHGKVWLFPWLHSVASCCEQPVPAWWRQRAQGIKEWGGSCKKEWDEQQDGSSATSSSDAVPPATPYIPSPAPFPYACLSLSSTFITLSLKALMYVVFWKWLCFIQEKWWVFCFECRMCWLWLALTICCWGNMQFWLAGHFELYRLSLCVWTEYIWCSMCMSHLSLAHSEILVGMNDEDTCWVSVSDLFLNEYVLN